jgi:hypothetical protein
MKRLPASWNGFTNPFENRLWKFAGHGGVFSFLSLSKNQTISGILSSLFFLFLYFNCPSHQCAHIKGMRLWLCNVIFFVSLPFFLAFPDIHLLIPIT